MKLRNLSAALVASCFVASSAAAVTVTHKTVTGGFFAAGAAVTVTFDIDETQTTVSNVGGDYGFLNEDPTQVDAGTHISWASNAELSNYYGAQFQFTGLTLTLDDGGQSFDYGSGYGAFEVFERNSPSSTSPRFEQQFTVIQSTGVTDYVTLTFAQIDQAAAFSTDFSSAVGQIGMAQSRLDYGPGFDASGAVLDAVNANCGGCVPNASQFIPFDTGSFSISGTGGSKPVLPQLPIAAVPVPAPFLMLGMAMLGLIGFGRRSRA